MLNRLLLLFSAVSSLAFGTTLATIPNAQFRAITTDGSGNIYAAGAQVTTTTSYALVVKLNSAGQVQYSTTFNGSQFNEVFAITVDSLGNAYVFGQTNSSDFPVTAGALQTTYGAAHQQGFAAKIDPGGKVLYATYIGGTSDVNPAAQGILVDFQGTAYLSGTTQTNDTPGSAPFPVTTGGPYTSTDRGTGFTIRIDSSGQKQLAAVRGFGGDLATDTTGNIYIAGTQAGTSGTPIPVTTGAVQGAPKNVCSALGAFFSCLYPYVAKLDSTLDQIAYSTYITGEYGGTPAGISVDAKGDVFVAGSTNSPNYPTTPDAYEPQYVAAYIPKTSCFFIIHCVALPPATGYLTELNSTGTALLYSSFFGGSEKDTITFAAFTPTAIYLGGQATSSDLPGFVNYPQPCLPQTYATRLSADGTEIGASRVTSGNVLAYDAFAGTLLAANGNQIVSINPEAPQTAIACILDSADLQPVSSIVPGELITLFGSFSSGSAFSPPAGQFPATLGSVTVTVNGTPSPLLYASPEQINFQAPFTLAALTTAEISYSSALQGVSDSRSLPVAAANPVAFLYPTPLPTALYSCVQFDSASVNGTLALTVNPDGSLNTCLNPAPPNSTVTLFFQGFGALPPGQVAGQITPNPPPALSIPAVTANNGMTVLSVSPMIGSIAGLFQVNLQLSSSATKGGNPVTFSVNGTAIRDTSLIVWVK